MGQLSVTEATAKRDLWLEAEEAVSTGQSIEVGGRTLTRVDLTQIRQAITYWSRMVDELTFAAAAPSTAVNHGLRVATFK